MMKYWTTEKLSALPAPRLEIVRQNAERAGEHELVQLCKQLQVSRRSAGARQEVTTGPDPVIGFHFVCSNDYEVSPGEGGKFWSGVWAVKDELCDPAISMNGYLALNSNKKEYSYRQGFIVDWRIEQRTKGQRQMGVTFLVQPFPTSMNWFGGGAGEKGYRRVSHSPSWDPTSV
jgi:hypothetical protein